MINDAVTVMVFTVWLFDSLKRISLLSSAGMSSVNTIRIMACTCMYMHVVYVCLLHSHVSWLVCLAKLSGHDDLQI